MKNVGLALKDVQMGESVPVKRECPVDLSLEVDGQIQIFIFKRN